MRQRLLTEYSGPMGSFDLTPIIDVVFLLIIFFLLVFQFITAEQSGVQVPDSIRSADLDPPRKDIPTVTVGYNSRGEVFFAVDGMDIQVSDRSELPSVIADLVDNRLSEAEDSKKIVRLRCDKQIPFGSAKYALKGIVRSGATDIQWSVLKED